MPPLAKLAMSAPPIGTGVTTPPLPVSTAEVTTSSCNGGPLTGVNVDTTPESATTSPRLMMRSSGVPLPGGEGHRHWLPFSVHIGPTANSFSPQGATPTGSSTKARYSQRFDPAVVPMKIDGPITTNPASDTALLDGI